MKKYLLLLFCAFLVQTADAQYFFSLDYDCHCTPIKNQQKTGTCWSFSTVSFLESELIRMGKPEYDLSEMYIVRNIYSDKARNYMLRQGKANFSQGSLAHDVTRALKMGGVVPESVYNGKLEGEKMHDHGEMEAALKGMLDNIVKRKKPSPKWVEGFEALMDVYIGSAPETFTYKGESYTSESFAASLGINPDDYISFSSYTHHPFYEDFVLEIPDNYSNGSYYNVPMEDLAAIADNAIKTGYSVSWDGDVSEKGFSARNGMAVLPVDPKREDLFKNPGAEIKVTQELRQKTFLNYETTDDHLMHITGIGKDQKGNKYYLVKNSWGEISEHEGFLYMSEAYFLLKTVGLLVHKDAVPKHILEKAGI